MALAAVPSIRNVFACLVHENLECIVDLVRNLRHLDPSSTVLLYNGSKDPHLLDSGSTFAQFGAELHPTPRPMAWGRLHEFALDCMRFALDHLPFDTLTIVDSDQLALRPGYSERLATYLTEQPGVGLLGNSAAVETSATRVPPARIAHAEFELWRPLLRRFPEGEANYVHWSFWPSTVFTAEAARALVKFFDEDQQLRQILGSTRVWATEEVILPTLVALLGFRIATNPCSYDYVKYRTPYSIQQLDAALSRPDVFWAHPIPRRYEDPLRQHIRGRYHNYAKLDASTMSPGTEVAVPPPFPLTLPILARMKRIEGWLDDDEADLLIQATAQALRDLPQAPAVVEVGSHCGRGTIVLASVAKAIRPTARVWAIDPHDGKVGTAEKYLAVGRTLAKLKANIAATGLVDVVEVIEAAAPQVTWQEPIAILLIDGLHDYASVSRDFAHFEPWVADGGYVAFHDYAAYFPGVVLFVDQLIAAGAYQRVHAVNTMIILQKKGLRPDNPINVP